MNPPFEPSGADPILFTAFHEAMEITEEALPAMSRRQRPVTFPPGEPVTATAPYDALGPLEREADALFRIHPYQSAAGREGAFRFLAEYRAMLGELVGLPVVGHPAARFLGVAEQLTELLGGRIVHIRTASEAAAANVDAGGDLILDADGGIDDLDALGSENIALVSPAAVEALTTGTGTPRLLPLLKALRQHQALVGVAVADLRWIAAGFAPAALGFDFAVLDFAPFLPEGAAHHLPLFRAGILVSESLARIGDDGAWFPFLDVAVRIDLRLRQLGAPGLRRLAEDAAIRSAYLQARLKRHAPHGGAALGGSLLETYVRGIPAIRVDGDETKSDLDGLAVQLTICQ